MNVFQSITESPAALAALLRTIPAIETPWDDAFNPLWWLGLPAEEVEK